MSGRKAVVGTAVAAMILATTASTAVADAPPGLAKQAAEQWICDGEEVTIVAPGSRPGWIDGVHYMATTLEFTVTVGGEVVESSSKTWPSRSDEGEVSCTLDFTDGPAVIHGEVTAVPVR